MTEPSAHFRQHHEIEAPRIDDRHFRPAWRVLTRLDRLLSDRAITRAEWHAAADYRELVDQIAAVTLMRSSIGRGALAPMVGRAVSGFSLAGELDALRRLREIRSAIGGFACTLLDLSVVRDLSWAALGRRYCVDPKTARSWVVAAIKTLRAA